MARNAPELTQSQAISILCSAADHPVNAPLERWRGMRGPGIEIVRSQRGLAGGDFLFLISCGEILPQAVRDKYRHALVVHASDLPNDRGWSPHIWAILEGRDEIVVSLLAAADPTDCGAIWRQERFALDGTETFDEINAKLFAAEIALMDWALENCDQASPRPQAGEPSFRRRRTPSDSAVRSDQTIAEVFDLLRVSDPHRFPAYFDHRGAQYEIAFRRREPRGGGDLCPGQG